MKNYGADHLDPDPPENEIKFQVSKIPLEIKKLFN